MIHISLENNLKFWMEMAFTFEQKNRLQISEGQKFTEHTL